MLTKHKIKKQAIHDSPLRITKKDNKLDESLSKLLKSSGFDEIQIESLE